MSVGVSEYKDVPNPKRLPWIEAPNDSKIVGKISIVEYSRVRLSLYSGPLITVKNVFLVKSSGTASATKPSIL